MVYKSIDLFAGIGGIRMGFDNAFGKNIETNSIMIGAWSRLSGMSVRPVGRL